MERGWFGLSQQPVVSPLPNLHEHRRDRDVQLGDAERDLLFFIAKKLVRNASPDTQEEIERLLLACGVQPDPRDPRPYIREPWTPEAVLKPVRKWWSIVTWCQ